MKNVLIYIIIGVLLSSCGLRPYGVLSQDEMVDILLEIHVVDAAILVLDSRSKQIEKQEYYNQVFAKYGLTKEQFDKSLEWYSSRPDVMFAIYEEVKIEAAELQRRVESYEFHANEKPSREDSIVQFDLLDWKGDSLFVRNENFNIPIDSFHFCIKDSDYLSHSESLSLYLKMRVYAKDSVSFATRMVCYFSDSIVDTLQYISFADSICRRYYFTQDISSDRSVDSVFIELIDSVRTIDFVKIDSVELNKGYNKYLYPMKGKIRTINTNDSLKLLKINSWRM
jgi:hypothetical protein